MRIQREKYKFNYIILGNSWDLYKYAYSEIVESGDAFYIGDRFVNYLKGIRMRTKNCTLESIYIRLLYFVIVTISYFKGKSRLPVCLILFGSWPSFCERTDFVDFFKKRKPSSKFIWFAQDIIDLAKNINREPLFNKVKNQFDLIISYDKTDADRYQLLYHHTVFSNIHIKAKEEIPFYDVFFIGKYKSVGRLNQLYAVHHRLSLLGLKCGFYLLNVPPKDQIAQDGIYYINKQMGYKQMLNYVKKARCLLEVMQDNAVGCTYRTWEAITYDKFLLTNNKSVKDLPMFNNFNIIYFEQVSSIDNTIADRILMHKVVDYNGKELLSPSVFLKFVDANL